MWGSVSQVFHVSGAGCRMQDQAMDEGSGESSEGTRTVYYQFNGWERALLFIAHSLPMTLFEIDPGSILFGLID